MYNKSFTFGTLFSPFHVCVCDFITLTLSTPSNHDSGDLLARWIYCLTLIVHNDTLSDQFLRSQTQASTISDV